MSTKINETLGLLGLLIVIFVVKPNILIHAFNTLLGRIALIAIIIYFSKSNMFLGLFVALCLILALHLKKMGIYTVEGFEQVARTIGDESQKPTLKSDEGVEKVKVLTSNAVQQMKGPAQSTPSEVPHSPVPGNVEEMMKDITQKKEMLINKLKGLAQKYNLCENNKVNDGIDRQTVEESIRPMKPSSIPVSKNEFKSGDNVAPSDKAVEGFAGMCALSGSGCPYCPNCMGGRCAKRCASCM